MPGQTTGGLALTLAGGLIGTIIAPGIGTSIGLALGGLVGSIAFPADPLINEGPRLGDLDVTTSTPGRPRPIGYGAMRIAGNIIWALPIEEVVDEDEIGGGFFGLIPPSGINITYTYFGNFAVAFGEGPAVDVFRIWANNKLIYSKGEKHQKESGLNFRFYTGDDKQLPDGLILQNEGSRTPGFRNTVYIVFQDLLLTNYGNTLPQIQAEIVYNRTIDPQAEQSSLIEGGMDGYQNDFWAYDVRSRIAWGGDATGDPQGLRKFDMEHLMEVLQVTEAQVLVNALEDPNQPNTGIYFNHITQFHDGGLVIQTQTGSTTNSKIVSRLDSNGIETDRFPEPPYDGVINWSSTRGTTQTVPACAFGASLVATHPLYGPTYFWLGVNLFGDSFSILRYPSMGYVWDSESDPNTEVLPKGLFVRPRGIATSETPDLKTQRAAATAQTAYVTVGWTLSGQSTNYLHSISSGFGAAHIPDGVGGDRFIGVTFSTTSFTASDFFGSGEPPLRSFGTGLKYDETDGNLIFFIQRDNLDIHVTKVTPGGNVLWVSDNITSVVGTFSIDMGRDRLESGTYGFIYDDNAALLDTNTGEILFLDTGISWPYSINIFSTGVWDSRNGSFFSLSNPALPTIWYLERYTVGPESVGTIVRDVCTRLDLADADLDTTDIDPFLIPGYVISRQMNGRQAIQPLQYFYFFDGVESDFKLKFIARGNSSIRTIQQDELGFVNEQTSEYIRETRKQEVELPERFSTTYMNYLDDYQQDTQSGKRFLNPAPSMYSHDQQTLEIAGAFDPTEVKRQAEKALYTAWQERKGFEYKLAWTHLDLDPTDVVTIALDSATIRSRISTFDIVEGFAIDVTSIAEESNQFITSGTTAFAGEGGIIQTVRSNFEIAFFLVDSPHLEDTDEPLTPTILLNYWYAGGIETGTFISGTLFQSEDELVYKAISRISREMTYGFTVNALGDPPDDNPYITDRVNTIQISVVAGVGNFQSVTEAQMLDGSNQLLLLKQNGEVEVVHFTNVTTNADGTLTLDTLLRGRRGTDTMAFSHTTGEAAILVISGDRKYVPLDLAFLDTPLFYKGLGQNEFVSQSETITFTSEGRAMMPYWPSQFDFSVDGSNNITITWVRRTRINGVEVDDTDFVPLNEDSEVYELEILDGPGGSVVRTFTGITTPSQVWTAAQQTTDGFNAPAQEFTIRVYQVSGQVGRGFSREVTLGEELPFAISPADSITIGEAITVQFSLLEIGAAYAPIEEAVTIEEVASVYMPFVIDNEEAVTVGESVTLRIPLLINVEDAVTVGEAVGFGPATIEDITVGESVTLHVPLAINIEDAITVGEAVTVTLA